VALKKEKLFSRCLPVSKLVALFGLVVFGFLLTKQNYWAENWKLGFQSLQDLGVDGSGKIPVGWTEIGGVAFLGAIAASMTGSLFSSDAWNSVTLYCRRNKKSQTQHWFEFISGYTHRYVSICNSKPHVYLCATTGWHCLSKS
jgi:hypothetical protein